MTQTVFMGPIVKATGPGEPHTFEMIVVGEHRKGKVYPKIMSFKYNRLTEAKDARATLSHLHNAHKVGAIKLFTAMKETSQTWVQQVWGVDTPETDIPYPIPPK